MILGLTRLHNIVVCFRIIEPVAFYLGLWSFDDQKKLSLQNPEHHQNLIVCSFAQNNNGKVNHLFDYTHRSFDFVAFAKN